MWGRLELSFQSIRLRSGPAVPFPSSPLRQKDQEDQEQYPARLPAWEPSRG